MNEFWAVNEVVEMRYGFLNSHSQVLEAVKVAVHHFSAGRLLRG